MTAELRRSFFLAFAGSIAGFALVVTLFGTGELLKRGVSPSEPKEAPPAVAALPPTAETPREPGASPVPGKSRTAEERAALPPNLDAGSKPPPSGPAQPDARAEPAPSFDIIRVEPNGDAVIAGRGVPNTTVELLRDNQPIARALIDPSGQFAIVPPALPTGNSEITLRATGADGAVRVAKESVVVVVAQRRDAKPLIALTSPDKPTVVISQPEPVASPAPKTAKARPGKPETGAGGSQAALAPGADRKPKASEPAPVKIVSVDAEEGGRLYVTSQAPPGATVRLYLNDTLVAPGSAGPDGRVAFTIGRGVKPGDYRIRVDQVDPVSGKVKTRSEVAFAVPAAAKAPARDKPAETAPVAALAQPAMPPPAPSSLVERQTSTAPLAPAARRDPSIVATKPVSPTVATAPEIATPMSATAPKPMTAEAADAPVAESRTVFVPEIGTARIIRGDNLWQISRRIYGKGTRYTVIFDANQPQIRNPDLIFPGQIFVVPPEAAEAARADGKRG
ncbi:MAG TPA: LysM peptidoglycan-binding domain-containing protein [Methylobacterium sp.]|jgi:nucleoid-associated protein YgaU